MRLKRARVLVAAILLAAILGFGSTAITAPHASAAGSGDVQCYYVSNEVVGIWVQVSGGTSGWATRWNDGYGGNYYSYYEIDNGKSYTLHIGCGGTPDRWGITFYTSPQTGYHDWVCSVSYGCIMS